MKNMHSFGKIEIGILPITLLNIIEGNKGRRIVVYYGWRP